jgi:ribosome-associated protein
VNALIRSVKEEVKKEYGIHPRLEGEPRYGWMVADYGDLVLHIFSPERRAYYRLEDLWAEGKTILRLQ